MRAAQVLRCGDCDRGRRRHCPEERTENSRRSSARCRRRYRSSRSSARLDLAIGPPRPSRRSRRIRLGRSAAERGVPRNSGGGRYTGLEGRTNGVHLAACQRENRNVRRAHLGRLIPLRRSPASGSRTAILSAWDRPRHLLPDPTAACRVAWPRRALPQEVTRVHRPRRRAHERRADLPARRWEVETGGTAASDARGVQPCRHRAGGRFPRPAPHPRVYLGDARRANGGHRPAAWSRRHKHNRAQLCSPRINGRGDSGEFPEIDAVLRGANV